MFDRKLLLITSLTFSLVGCISLKQPQNRCLESHYSWIIGKWQSGSENGLVVEEWVRENDSVFFGKNYLVHDNDTNLLETIKLVQVQDLIFYIPAVIGQNEGKPVEFLMTYGSSKKMVFNNPNHDFPQTITYQRIGEDSLCATVSGNVDGKMQAEKFGFKKMK